jgi:hypothetical protein
MAWIIPIASIAAGLLTKMGAEKKAKKANLENTLMAIDDARTRQLGGDPYAGMVSKMALGNRDIERQAKEAINPLGMALQGMSAASGALGGGSSGKDDVANSFGKFTDERSGYDALKAAESAGDSGSIGTSNPFQLDKPSLLDDDNEYSLNSKRFRL